jgi:uncharacterized protein YjiS (DUF1127 family)
MPTVDLSLPPRSYPVWRARRPRFSLYGLPPFHILMSGWHLIATWIERVRQRRALAALDDRMLRDIGVTRAEAARETEKPFWR